MRFPNTATCCLMSFLMLGALATAQDPTTASLWRELDQMLPRRGQTGPINSPSAAIDWNAHVGKAEQLMVRAGGTPVEPFAMLYLGNFCYEAGRLDEALAMYQTIQAQFPKHPLVTLQLAKEQKPVVVKALEDCAAEIGFRAKHPRPEIPLPVLDTKMSATLHLSTGDVKIRFYANAAPKHVENFLKHAKAGDYDGTKVTQIMAESVVNLGDPASKLPPTTRPDPATPATAGPSQPHEFANLSHVRGMVAMGRHLMSADSSTMSFQFVLKDQPYFDFTQTIFARIVEGLEVADAISKLPKDQYQKPATDVVLKNITISAE